ncbi:MAG: XF1762 family protein [Pseudomonadota bacterium]
MKIVPITLQQAKDFVRAHHRHNKPPVGWKFGVGVQNEAGQLVGVATAGRPVARALAGALEINRTCTTGERNANSMLYGAIRRAAVAMGYKTIYTYTQADECGASLRAAGFREDASLPSRGNWAESSVSGRAKRDSSEPSGVARVRWVWP